LANQFPKIPDTLSARTHFDIESLAAVTAILPGSRMSEINRMADVYIQSAKLLADIYPKMLFLIPYVHEKAKVRIQEAVDQFGRGLNIRLVDGQSRQVLEASDQALVTSGTATLECALMKKPLVLAIKVHPVSYWMMKRLATTQWIGLPNILANQSLVSELIQDQATPHKIAIQMGRLIMDTQLRAKQIKAFEAQYSSLRQNASELAADAIEEWAGLKEKFCAK
jgi:lipid-A-disaccharide synthase